MKTVDTDRLLERSPQFYFKTALTLLKDQQFSSALQSIDAAIVFSHHSPFYIYQKIRMLYQIGDYQTCSSLITSQLPYLYKHGSLYILCRVLDYLQKINHYSTDYLENLLIHYRLPYCLATCYTTLLTERRKPFFSLAHQAMVQDHYALCLCYCNLYLKLHEATPELYAMQTYAYHMLGDLDSAYKCCTKYLQHHPQDAVGYANLGLILMELKDYDASIHALNQAYALDSSNIVYLQYLGECYRVSNRFEEAIDTHERIAKLSPDNLQNYFNLFYLYNRTSKPRLSKRYTKLIQKTIQKLSLKGVMSHE